LGGSSSTKRSGAPSPAPSSMKTPSGKRLWNCGVSCHAEKKHARRSPRRWSLPAWWADLGLVHGALQGEERAHEERQGGGEKSAVPREHETDPVGERKNPLPHRDSRDDPVHEVGCGVLGGPRGARGADAPSPAREADEDVVAAVIATDAGETMGQDPTRKVPSGASRS
jgi:hypothetical protein